MIQHERLTLVESSVPGVDPAVSPDDPVMGVWWTDESKGHLDRGVATPTRRYGVYAPHRKIQLGKWVFTSEGQGVRLQHFTGSGPDSPVAALIDFFATWDGRPWADPHGPAFPGQLVQYWRLAPCMIVRLVLDNVVPPERVEWTTYAISTDGSTLAAASWDAATPQHHDLLVFNKHGGGSSESSRPGFVNPAPRTTTAEPPARVPPGDPILGVWIADASEAPLQGQQEVALPGTAGRKLRFVREGDGIREEHFGGAVVTTPLTSFFYRFDGSEHPRLDAQATTERVTSWKIDSHLVVRCLGTKNQRSIWSTYAIAPDGSSMVVTSWDEGTSYDQHIQVFGRAVGDK